MIESLFNERFLKDFPLSQYTSFRCGGKVKYLIYPETIDEVKIIIEISKKYKKDFLFIGKGTNILVSDNGFDGIAISTLKMKKTTIKENKIIGECGLEISEILNICIKNSLTGLEFLAGIPGTIGGAIKNNAGLKTEWISEKITYVEYLDVENLDIIKKERKDIYFYYRRSGFRNEFIWKVEFLLEKEKQIEIKKRISEYMKERIRKQPLGYSAGSIFKNPYPYYAGELIEKCGLKGYKIGDCYISEKHANFIINRGKGKSQDVYNLIKIVKQKVKEKFDIDLELEINIIGEFK
ncbi:MAG: UDP-N-acetylmuramate dehydrogenase [Candidatus Omnitrophica bacterium]|nr:UDP-N-acetylmuramate dehydrogenase [Candidatus Omnitrophota bacterium]MCM8801830.1 UDP-N-acetylmuramate dehydrogenase [Candidatus Omnitrophota bacterium]